jgi:putative SOS response-associated peptidase YedK
MTHGLATTVGPNSEVETKCVAGFQQHFRSATLKSAGIFMAIFAPRYNIAPSQTVPVIVKSDRGHEAKLMK